MFKEISTGLYSVNFAGDPIAYVKKIDNTLWEAFKTVEGVYHSFLGATREEAIDQLFQEFLGREF